MDTGDPMATRIAELPRSDVPRNKSLPLISMLLAFALAPRSAGAVTLDEALQAAEKNSTGLGLAEEQAVQARALRGQAFALVSPKLVANGSYTINDKEITLDFTESIPAEYKELLGLESDPITLQQKTAWGADVSVIQPLFDAQSLPLLRGAFYNVDAADSGVDSARQQVRAGAAKAYYGLVVARGMESLSGKAIDAARAHEAIIDKQVEIGLAPERAALQAELAVARAERDHASAREGVVLASQAFASLTGLPTTTEVSLPETPIGVPDGVEQALEKAQAQQPELEAALAQARAADLLVTARKLNWLPTLNGRFTWVYSENTGFTDDPTMWMVVFEGKWVAWDGGARIGQTREAASQARQANLLAKQASIDAEAGVRTAWERHQQASAALQSAERERALAAENLRLVEVALANGGATVLDVDDARLGLLAAEMATLQERANRDLAAIDLRVAMGAF